MAEEEEGGRSASSLALSSLGWTSVVGPGNVSQRAGFKFPEVSEISFSDPIIKVQDDVYVPYKCGMSRQQQTTAHLFLPSSLMMRAVLFVFLTALLAGGSAAFAPASHSRSKTTFQTARVVPGARMLMAPASVVLLHMAEKQQGEDDKAVTSEKPAAPTSGTFYDDEVRMGCLASRMGS